MVVLHCKVMFLLPEKIQCYIERLKQDGLMQWRKMIKSIHDHIFQMEHVNKERVIAKIKVVYFIYQEGL